MANFEKLWEIRNSEKVIGWNQDPRKVIGKLGDPEIWHKDTLTDEQDTTGFRIRYVIWTHFGQFAQDMSFIKKVNFGIFTSIKNTYLEQMAQIEITIFFKQPICFKFFIKYLGNGLHASTLKKSKIYYSPSMLIFQISYF